MEVESKNEEEKIHYIDSVNDIALNDELDATSITNLNKKNQQKNDIHNYYYYYYMKITSFIQTIIVCVFYYSIILVNLSLAIYYYKNSKLNQFFILFFILFVSSILRIFTSIFINRNYLKFKFYNTIKKNSKNIFIKRFRVFIFIFYSFMLTILQLDFLIW